MDIAIELGKYKLNIRAAAVIIHKNKILVHKNNNLDHYALVGGRVEIGENSIDAIKREIKEEIGKEIEITGNIATIENFFKKEGTRYHEIMFVHRAEFVDNKDKLIEYNLENIEGKDYLKYEWLEIGKIQDYPLKPKVIQEILKENKFPIHKINSEK